MENTKLAAPRILNAPPVWKFSHLKNAVTPASASNPWERITGVRFAIFRMRSLAARISSKVISWRMVSVAGMFIHQIHQRLARLKTLQILQESFYGKMNEILHMVRRVRRQQHVFHAIKRMSRRQWLHGEHVQRSSPKLSIIERLYQ